MSKTALKTGVNKLENKKEFARFITESCGLVVTNHSDSEDFKIVDEDTILKQLLAGAFSLYEQISEEFWLCRYVGAEEFVKIEVL